MEKSPANKIPEFVHYHAVCSSLATRRMKFSEELRESWKIYRRNMKSLMKLRQQVEKYAWYANATGASDRGPVFIESVDQRQVSRVI